MKKMRVLFIVLILSGCNIVVGDNNVTNSVLIGPSGYDSSEPEPGASYVNGVGLYFMECVVLSSSSYQFTLRNVGSVEIQDISITWQIDFLDGSRKFGESQEYWGSFLPGEIKVFDFGYYDFDSPPTPVSLTI